MYLAALGYVGSLILDDSPFWVFAALTAVLLSGVWWTLALVPAKVTPRRLLIGATVWIVVCALAGGIAGLS